MIYFYSMDNFTKSVTFLFLFAHAGNDFMEWKSSQERCLFIHVMPSAYVGDFADVLNNHK